MVGWDAAGLRTLLSVPITDEPPLRKPGCAAKNTYDPEELRLLDGAGISTSSRRCSSAGGPTGCP